MSDVAPGCRWCVVKGGATAGGAKAAASHTGSLSTDDRTFDGACRQAGRHPGGDRRGGLRGGRHLRHPAAAAGQPGGGDDHGRRVGRRDRGRRSPGTPTSSWSTSLRTCVAAIDEHLPPRWSRSNPVDLAGGETRDTIPAVLELIASHPESVDAVVYLGLGIQSNQARMLREGPFGDDPDVERIVAYHERQDARFAQAAHDVSVATGKPILTATELAVAFPDNPGPATVRATGRLCYASADRAVTALGPSLATQSPPPAPRPAARPERRGMSPRSTTTRPRRSSRAGAHTRRARRRDAARPGAVQGERRHADGATRARDRRPDPRRGGPRSTRWCAVGAAAPPSATRRRPGSGRRWLVAAAVLGLVGLLALVAAWLTDGEVAVACLRSRRAGGHHAGAVRTAHPELVARPVASRNLRAAVEPVLAQAPADTCLQVRDGANAVVSQKEGDAVIPASNLKLVTAAATLDAVGSDSRGSPPRSPPTAHRPTARSSGATST